MKLICKLQQLSPPACLNKDLLVWLIATAEWDTELQNKVIVLIIVDNS